MSDLCLDRSTYGCTGRGRVPPFDSVNVGVPVVKVFSHPSATDEQRASIVAALSRPYRGPSPVLRSRTMAT